MQEVLGYDLDGFFNNTSLNGTKKYSNKHYEVWEVPDIDFKAMCIMTEEEFGTVCPIGWWRSSEGAVLGVPNMKYIVNGVEMLGWDGEERKDFREECCAKDCDDFGDECKGKDDDILVCLGERKYDSLIDYLYEEIGASTEKNICACAMDLAKYNNLSLGELFNKYEPLSR